MVPNRHETAMPDVGSVFAQPPDILEAGDLTREQKIELLKQRGRVLNQLITAWGEGMIAPRHGLASVRLQDVRKMLTALGAQEKPE